MLLSIVYRPTVYNENMVRYSLMKAHQLAETLEHQIKANLTTSDRIVVVTHFTPFYHIMKMLTCKMYFLLILHPLALLIVHIPSSIPKWAPFGPNWGPLGAQLSQTGAQLGPIWNAAWDQSFKVKTTNDKDIKEAEPRYERH